MNQRSTQTIAIEAKPKPSHLRPPNVIGTLSSKKVRFSGELKMLDALKSLVDLGDESGAKRPRTGEQVRRALMARALMLTPSMAPQAHEWARQTSTVFGLKSPVELYQSAGADNASMYLVEKPILMEVKGKILSLLGDGEALALFGHELGHWFAHGANSALGGYGSLARGILQSEDAPAELTQVAARLSMAQELTANS